MTEQPPPPPGINIPPPPPPPGFGEEEDESMKDEINTNEEKISSDHSAMSLSLGPRTSRLLLLPRLGLRGPGSTPSSSPASGLRGPGSGTPSSSPASGLRGPGSGAPSSPPRLRASRTRQWRPSSPPPPPGFEGQAESPPPSRLRGTRFDSGGSIGG